MTRKKKHWLDTLLYGYDPRSEGDSHNTIQLLFSLAVRLDEIDEAIGGGIVAADHAGLLQLRLNHLCQLLAQFHAGGLAGDMINTPTFKPPPPPTYPHWS